LLTKCAKQINTILINGKRLYIPLKAAWILDYTAFILKPFAAKGFSGTAGVFLRATGFSFSFAALAVCAFQPILATVIFLVKRMLTRKKHLYLSLLKKFKKTTMNKAELIAKIADDAGITKTQANDTLDSFVEAVTKTLKGGGKVTLVGFGTFSVSKRAARNGRNPQTGAVIKIKAKKVAKFKAGKELSAKL
jgi:DNA-binding protein HU-beta